MMEQADDIRTQYSSDRNLNARIALHARFSTNTYGWQRWVFNHLTLPDTARVLELGCGPGALWTGNQESLPTGWEVVLTDFSPGMASTARQNLSDVTGRFALVVADAQTVPARTDAFDGIIANHMLYHIPDRERALVEMRRVLTPGGRIFATTIGEFHMKEMWDLVAPFVPDIHTRTRKVSQGFTLENGGEQLKSVFTDVVRYDYEDALEVTEMRPIIDYITSSNTLMGCSLAPNEWATVRRKITAHIEVKGSFHIRKASGIFVARG
ncbi:MAG: class I SAM-dependent methyltransferase [Anaerolineae bacterium]|nr:class I SAM-dependent methyltransferase [Anaerolineae bacterium]